MPGLVLSRVPRTVVGTLVARFRSASGADRSCPWSGNAEAGLLTPRDTRYGLDAPMPHSIAPVLWGRLRPSPDRVSQGAPADRHRRRVMASGLPVLAGEGVLPVLGAPAAGVGGIDGDDGDAELGGHRYQPCPQFGGGHAGNQLAEALPAPVLLARLLRREIQVLDRDGRPVALGPVQQTGQGMPQVCVVKGDSESCLTAVSVTA